MKNKFEKQRRALTLNEVEAQASFFAPQSQVIGAVSLGFIPLCKEKVFIHMSSNGDSVGSGDDGFFH